MARVLALLPLAALLVLGWGYGNVLRDPVVRRAEVAVPGWRDGAPPLRAALLTDIHLGGPDMPPERLARIVAQVNAERPDLVLLAGDYFSDKTISTRHYPSEALTAPLAGLRARLGVFAVLGNHDHWRDAPAVERALVGAGARILDNLAVRAEGLTLAGVDDVYTRHARYRALETYAAALPGPTVLLSHTPDVVAKVSARFQVVLAGHTHCGQIVLPIIGRLKTASVFGDRYACGVTREPERTVIVSAGLGTSILPLRFGAPPDWWMITLGPGRSAPGR